MIKLIKDKIPPSDKTNKHSFSSDWKEAIFPIHMGGILTRRKKEVNEEWQFIIQPLVPDKNLNAHQKNRVKKLWTLM